MRQFKNLSMVFQIVIRNKQRKFIDHQFMESGPGTIEHYINNIVFNGLDESLDKEEDYHFSVYTFLPGKDNNFIKERIIFKTLDEKDYLLVYPRVHKYIFSKTPYLNV